MELLFQAMLAYLRTFFIVACENFKECEDEQEGGRIKSLRKPFSTQQNQKLEIELITSNETLSLNENFWMQWIMIEFEIQFLSRGWGDKTVWKGNVESFHLAAAI